MMGAYAVSMALGVVLAGAIMLTWLIFKGRRGGAYADMTQ